MSTIESSILSLLGPFAKKVIVNNHSEHHKSECWWWWWFEIDPIIFICLVIERRKTLLSRQSTYGVLSISRALIILFSTPSRDPTWYPVQYSTAMSHRRRSRSIQQLGNNTTCSPNTPSYPHPVVRSSDDQGLCGRRLLSTPIGYNHLASRSVYRTLKVQGTWFFFSGYLWLFG